MSRGIAPAIILGEFAIITLEKFFLVKNKGMKALCIFGFIMSSLVYFGLFWTEYYSNFEYNSFTRAMLLIYLSLAIWLILKNTEKLSMQKRIGIVFLSFVITIVGLVISKKLFIYLDNDILYLNNETNGLMHLFSYGYSMFLPFVNTGKNVTYSSFLSLFPLPLIIAIIYVYREEKNTEFFLPMIIVIVFESIFCILKKPLLGLDMCFDFVAGAIGLACIYLYMYMIAHIEENMFKLKDSAKIVLVFLVFYFLVPQPEVFMSKGYMYILAMLITLLYFLFINFADKRYQKVLLVVLSIWSIVSAVPLIFIGM